MKTDPPCPLVADPDPIYKAPLLPTLVVPELNTKRPLTPPVPAFAVFISNDPLLEPVAHPERMFTEPPVACVPPLASTSPP